MNLFRKLFRRKNKKDEGSFNKFVDELIKTGKELQDDQIDEIKLRHAIAHIEGKLPAPDIAVKYDCECGSKNTFHMKNMNPIAGHNVTCAHCGAVLHVPPTVLNHSEYWEGYGGASLVPGWQDQMEFVKNGKQLSATDRCEEHDFNCASQKCSKCGKPSDGQVEHDWEGCRCRKCKKVRDKEHDWEGCRCRKCKKVRDEEHDWEGCRCRKCKKVRDEEHDWEGCRCRKCKKVRDEEHDWEGCRCRKCKKVRDEEHDWEGCRCRKCKKVRDEEHDFNCASQKCSKCGKPSDGQVEHKWDGCICQICGKERDQDHDWEGCICNNCYMLKDQNHKWDGCKCQICGKVRDEEHDWEGCRCRKCKKVRDEEHDWEGCRCRKCKKVRDEEHDWEGSKCQICGKAREKDLETYLKEKAASLQKKM